MYRFQEETVWSFETARFAVELHIAPEDMGPADSFEFEEDIAAVRDGTVEWFQASVVIKLDGREIARDSLGGCAYNSVREFFTSHRDPDPMNRNCSVMRAAKGDVCIGHYFPGMVSEAIAEARRRIDEIPKLRAA